MKKRSLKMMFITLVVCLVFIGGVVSSFAIELEVGLILPGTVTDFGWDYAPVLALNGLEADFSDVLIGHKYAEIVSPADAEGVMMDLIASGCNWIWAWGFQYADACKAVSEKVGEGVYFSIAGGTEADIWPGRIENIDDFPEGTGYLAGIIAASISKTGKLGGVHGSLSASISYAEAGFVAGAKAYNPLATYQNVYVGSWGDPEGGRRAADIMLKSADIDVVFCVGDGTSLGVVQAVQQARARGEDVHYIGCYVDQSVLSFGNVLTSLEYDYYPVFSGQINDILEGKFAKSQKYAMQLGQGVELSPFYNFDSVIPDKAKEMIRQARKDILDGKLIVTRVIEK